MSRLIIYTAYLHSPSLAHTLPKKMYLPFRLAIIGSGLTGTTLVTEFLSKFPSPSPERIAIDVYEQGRGPGGRTASRVVNFPAEAEADVDRDADGEGREDVYDVMVNHGAQFFRCDTDVGRGFLGKFIKDGTLVEWKPVNRVVGFGGSSGEHANANANANANSNFFGFPSWGPFYIPPTGVMSSFVKSLSSSWPSDVVRYHGSTKVTSLTRDADEFILRYRQRGTEDVQTKKYDAVVITDGTATTGPGGIDGLPLSFKESVKERIENAGVKPIFAAILRLDDDNNTMVDTMTFNHPSSIWFARRYSQGVWVILSTIAFGSDEMSRNPMVGKDGSFVKQDKERLRAGPGMALAREFLERAGIDEGKLLEVECQRWGRGVTIGAGVVDDVVDGGGRKKGPGGEFVKYDEGMLFQSGDMVSDYEKGGAEGAIISAVRTARAIADIFDDTVDKSGEEL